MPSYGFFILWDTQWLRNSYDTCRKFILYGYGKFFVVWFLQLTILIIFAIWKHSFLNKQVDFSCIGSYNFIMNYRKYSFCYWIVCASICATVYLGILTLWTLAAGILAATWKSIYPGVYRPLTCAFCLQTLRCSQNPVNHSNLTSSIMICLWDIGGLVKFYKVLGYLKSASSS